MKKFLLLLSAITIGFIGCSEPGGGPIYLDPIDEKMLLETVDRRIMVYDSTETDNGGYVAEEIATDVIPVPFNLDDYFIAEGWMGNYDETSVFKGLCKADDEHTPTAEYCNRFKITPNYHGEATHLTGWGGISWLNKSNWGKPHRADSILYIGAGAKSIQFWAKTAQKKRDMYLHNDSLGAPEDYYRIENSDESIDTKKYENKFLAVIGNTTTQNTFGGTFVICVKNEWRKFEIPLQDSIPVLAEIFDGFVPPIVDYITLDDPHLQAGPFTWVTAKFDIPDGDSLVFFIDNVVYSDDDADDKFIPPTQGDTGDLDCPDGNDYRATKSEEGDDA